MLQTPKLGLFKPEDTDAFRQDDFNTNSDILDGILGPAVHHIEFLDDLTNLNNYTTPAGGMTPTVNGLTLTGAQNGHENDIRRNNFQGIDVIAAMRVTIGTGANKGNMALKARVSADESHYVMADINDDGTDTVLILYRSIGAGAVEINRVTQPGIPITGRDYALILKVINDRLRGEWWDLTQSDPRMGPTDAPLIGLTVAIGDASVGKGVAGGTEIRWFASSTNNDSVIMRHQARTAIPLLLP